MTGAGILVDSNILLDLLENDPQWYDWSAEQLKDAAESSILIINPVIYAEISVGFERIEELESLLKPEMFLRQPIPWEAAFWPANVFTVTANLAAYGVHHYRIFSSVLMRP